MTRPGVQNGAQTDPKIEPQTTPRSLRMTKKIASIRRSMFGPISAPILMIWGVQHGSKKHPKIDFGVRGSDPWIRPGSEPRSDPRTQFRCPFCLSFWSLFHAKAPITASVLPLMLIAFSRKSSDFGVRSPFHSGCFFTHMQ